MKYSKEFREAVLKRILPPQNESVHKVAKEEGITAQTIYNWRAKTQNENNIISTDEPEAIIWNTRDKFNIVVETIGMSEIELSEYARQKGLFVEQIHKWRDVCISANGGLAKEASQLNKALKESEKKARQMEKELIRKDKALAEAAALMLLQKKANAIWGEPEGE